MPQPRAFAVGVRFYSSIIPTLVKEYASVETSSFLSTQSEQILKDKIQGACRDMAEEGVTGERHSTYRRRRSSTSVRKRVRWADEERLQPSLLVIVVVVFNGIFGLLAVLSRWGFLWSPSGGDSVSSSSTVPVSTLPGVDDSNWRNDGNNEFRGIDSGASAHASAAYAPLKKRQTSASATTSALPIHAFQVDIPLLGPGGSVVGAGIPDGFGGIPIITTSSTAAASCEVTLVMNTFANSFESPFVGNYTPPACLTGDSNANTVVMNLTVQSQGRQFDRLFIL